MPFEFVHDHLRRSISIAIGVALRSADKRCTEDSNKYSYFRQSVLVLSTSMYYLLMYRQRPGGFLVFVRSRYRVHCFTEPGLLDPDGK